MNKVKLFGILISTSRTTHPDNGLCRYNHQTKTFRADIKGIGSLRVYFPYEEKK
jgi:hypothetical protein